MIGRDMFLFAYKSARSASGLYERREGEISRNFSAWLCDVDSIVALCALFRGK